MNDTLLRIYVDEDDRADGKLAYEAVVEALRSAGFGGVTVLRGIEGFGSHRQVHSTRAFEFSGSSPVVVEAIDTQERVSNVLVWLREIVQEGLITLQPVRAIRIGEVTPS